jgi:hypothetical protein
MVVAVVVGVRVARAAVGGTAVSGRAMGVFVGVLAVASRVSRGRGVVVVWRRAAAVAAYRRRGDGRLPTASRSSCVGALDGGCAAVGAARVAVVVVAVVCVVSVAPRPRLHASISWVSASRRSSSAVPSALVVGVRVVGRHGYGWQTAV